MCTLVALTGAGDRGIIPVMARIAILVEKIYEDLELQYPKYRLREAGHEVHVVGPRKSEVYVGT